jgi:2-dehydro-3-deoxygluconokinase
MLRFDPGDHRIRNTRHFDVYEGGGEYNVARNLAHSFRSRSAIITSLADNEIGRLVEDLIRQGGVDTTLIRWVKTDGISRIVRNGLYFWERGYGRRVSAGCSDRGNTAISQMQPDDIDWNNILETHGARWFHTGGIFAALSESTADAALEALTTARKSGSIVSYDLNFRHSLWAHRGGRPAADALNRKLLPLVDVVFGTLGYDPSLDGFEPSKFSAAAAAMMDQYPGLKLVCTTLRTVHHGSLHDLSAAAYDGKDVHVGPAFNGVTVLDRVGSGDAFAAGVVYELLSGRAVESAVRTGTAASLLAMTTPGDSLASTYEEVLQLASTDQLPSR